MYTATVVPYRTAFEEDTMDGWFYIGILFDTLFIIDLFINFMSAIEINDEEVDIRFKSIAKSYIKGWFFLDVIACIPFQLIELIFTTGEAAGGYNKLLRLARLPRLYRLLRILRLFKMTKIFKNNKNLQGLIRIIKMNTAIMKLIKVLAATILVIHLMTCFWFLFAKLEDFHPETWVVRVGILDERPWYQYLVSLNWAIQTLTTVGFGDVPSHTRLEIIVCCMWAI